MISSTVKNIINANTIEISDRWVITTEKGNQTTGTFIQIIGIELHKVPKDKTDDRKTRVSVTIKNLLGKLRLKHLLFPEKSETGKVVEIRNPERVSTIISFKIKGEEEKREVLRSEIYLNGINIATYFPDFQTQSK